MMGMAPWGEQSQVPRVTAPHPSVAPSGAPTTDLLIVLAQPLQPCPVCSSSPACHYLLSVQSWPML